ncbi:MAG: phage tail assembly chaperone [Comamonas sp.]|jgi:hypothetical protein|uniref:phage tail assembly chaperone n=1 Tax=Comamonas sp. TaxID=34028 RepID=UPI00283687B8|nr:phage tail assembly chaperone [Comamonas sp.]MDR0215616.1 phage tail assembly chaperone [Comamonas sp.]
MAKLTTLAGAPADFPLEVQVQDLSGAPVDVGFICIGRTLSDWHPIAVHRAADDANHALDAAATVKARSDTGQERLVINEAEVQEGLDKGFGRMIQIIREASNGWDLADEFSDANIAVLCSKFPGIHQSLWAKYDRRIRGDRLGN